MELKSFVLIIAILAVMTSICHASDPSPLQDFCVAVNDSMTTVFVNGKVCKDPKVVTAHDFFKLGISLARIDFAPYGLNLPHTHRRGTRGSCGLEGTLYVGFVLSNPGPNMKNKLFTKILRLIHFRFNVGKTNVVAFAGVGSQNPGVITIANAVFGSDPPINEDVLAKVFQVDKKVVDYLRSQFWWDNN
ncbi:unnamed protein product [Withania somnifera]